MSRRACGRLLPILLAGVGAWACKDEPPAQDEGGDEPPPPPHLELPAAELEVSAAETGEITLPVADLQADMRVDIDGQRWLPSVRGPAWLADGELHVALGGSMVVGTHELSLVQGSGPSEVATISVVEAAPIELSVTLDDTVVEQGDVVLAHGQGPDASLALLDLPSEQARVWAGAWSADPFELELPGVGDDPASADLAIVESPDARVVVLAWMLADGSAVHARVMPVDIHGVPIGDPSDVLEVVRLDDPDALGLLGSPELARIHAVALLERSVVVAIEARRDAEQPHIGDHVLLTRYVTSDAMLGDAIVLRGGAGQDLDLPGDARLWTPRSYDSALAVRVGLGFPWLLTPADNGLPGLDGDPGDGVALTSGNDWLASADAAFGSRHVFALDSEGASPRVQVLRLNRWSTPDESFESSEWVDLPNWPHSTPRLAEFSGIATLVVPMGSDADVLALQSTGAHTQVGSVAGLRCDALALAGAGFDGIGDTLPLACLRDRELRMGFLRGK